MHKISKVCNDKLVKQVAQSNESWKKQQEHLATVEAREARLTTEVVKLLKQNKELLEAEKKDKTKIDALKRKFG